MFFKPQKTKFQRLVIETFGDITHTYGSNYPSIPWGYRDSWAWKDTAAANVGNWVFGGDNCTDGSTTIQMQYLPRKKYQLHYQKLHLVL